MDGISKLSRPVLHLFKIFIYCLTGPQTTFLLPTGQMFEKFAQWAPWFITWAIHVSYSHNMISWFFYHDLVPVRNVLSCWNAKILPQAFAPCTSMSLTLFFSHHGYAKPRSVSSHPLGKYLSLRLSNLSWNRVVFFPDFLFSNLSVFYPFQKRLFFQMHVF